MGYDQRRRPQRVNSVLELDFRKGFCRDDFVMMLGSDGCASSDGDGLTINSAVFEDTQPTGEHGWLDHYKWSAYFKSAVDVHCSKETLFEAKISNKQIFDEASPLPIEFRNSVSDMFADPRLAHGQFGVIDPASGISAGFMLTDHQLYAVYARNSKLNILQYKDGYADECEPCKTQCSNNFGCSDFWQDCRYQDFKQNTTEPEFRRFVEYVAWKAFTDQNAVALNNFKIFCGWRKQSPTNCDALTRQDYVSWKSNYSWQEYCAFSAGWKDWFRQYKDWECCAEECLPEACGSGECSKRMFGGMGSSCYHPYTRDGKNCYDASVDRKPEEYSYQFGAARSCCTAAPANFYELIPVMRTEACDPLCDAIKVCVGIDRKYKTIKYYVNNQEVFKVVDAGRRLNDMYRVIELGGYAESVDISSVLVNFGTGSLLDASLPNNYYRYNAKNQKDATALVPLMPLEAYSYNYFNKAGELRHVEASHFAVVSSDAKFRIFHQGDVLKIQYINVLVRPASRDYPSLRSYCSYRTCCGPVGAGGGPTCVDDDGCCAILDDGSLDSRGGFDERDYNIEFFREGRDVPVVNDEGVESPSCKNPLRAKLTRTPNSKRYWAPNCRGDGFGSNPYL